MLRDFIDALNRRRARQAYETALRQARRAAVRALGQDHDEPGLNRRPLRHVASRIPAGGSGPSEKAAERAYRRERLALLTQESQRQGLY